MRLGDFIRIPNTKLSVIEPFFIPLIGLLIIHTLTTKKITFNTSLTKYFVAFFLFGLVNLSASIFFFNNDTAFALGQFRRICIYPVIYFIGYNYSGGCLGFKKIHLVYTSSLVVILFMGIFFYYFGINLDHHGYLQFYHHFEGWVVSYFLFYFIYRFRDTKKWVNSNSIYGLLAVIIIVLTNRRGVWFGSLLLSFGAYFISLKKITFTKISSFTIKLTIFITLFSFGSYYIISQSNSDVINSVQLRIMDTITNLENPNDVSDGGSIFWRLNIYSQSVDYILENPIFGKGLGFDPIFRMQHLYSWTLNDDVGFHNAYLHVLVTMGGVGLFLFLFIHLNFIVRVLKNRNKLPIGTKSIILSLFTVYLIGMLWANIANTLVSNVNFIFLIFFIMGIVTKEIDYYSLIEEKFIE